MLAWLDVGGQLGGPPALGMELTLPRKDKEALCCFAGEVSASSSPRVERRRQLEEGAQGGTGN